MSIQRETDYLLIVMLSICCVFYADRSSWAVA